LQRQNQELIASNSAIIFVNFYGQSMKVEAGFTKKSLQGLIQEKY
jgi:hypothetical protein